MKKILLFWTSTIVIVLLIAALSYVIEGSAVEFGNLIIILLGGLLIDLGIHVKSIRDDLKTPDD